ncbi:MAG: hypothetical protein EXR12_05815 [Rhodospirillaceae bacterium]|nr:hypothetical protein [Rhodospirillaceae bacterium]
MFAPFWLLGIAAVFGAVWHMVHFTVVHARARAAGHVPRASFFSRRLQWHELSDDGRHHLRRALIAFGAFFGLCAGGIVMGVVAAFVMRV